MEQGTHAQHLFDVRQGGARRLHGTQGRIELPGKPSSYMHGPQGMLEAAMLSGRKDPAGALELLDIPQALHPRRVNQVLLRDLWSTALSHTRYREGNVFVNRISEQGQALVVFLRLCWRYGPNVY
jgi:hypothetical protein